MAPLVFYDFEAWIVSTRERGRVGTVYRKSLRRDIERIIMNINWGRRRRFLERGVDRGFRFLKRVYRVEVEVRRSNEVE